MSEPDAQPLLAEATLEQICVEVAHRGDNALIVLTSGSGTVRERFRLFHSGGLFPAVGLAACAHSELLRAVGRLDEIPKEDDRP